MAFRIRNFVDQFGTQHEAVYVRIAEISLRFAEKFYLPVPSERIPPKRVAALVQFFSSEAARQTGAMPLFETHVLFDAKDVPDAFASGDVKDLRQTLYKAIKQKLATAADVGPVLNVAGISDQLEDAL